MQIRDLFDRDVTREIPPVIYFHEQDPAAVAEEVAEYIITGGFQPGDARHQRVPRGIHEQLSKLLTNLAAELGRPGGPDLPASWISGFYGSGKSSFAKLLGLALDGLVLPDGRRLADALLEKDDSPNKDQLRDAWLALESRVEPIAVVFDVGSAAREGEHVAATALRQVQKRLGYCAVSHHVADYELRLELEGRFQDLERLAREHFDGRPWTELAASQLADDHFSLLMHHLYPDHYDDPMSWLDARAGSRTGAGTSIEEITRAMADMLERRARGKTLFIVVDEVSQYIHQHDDRQLRLQSFVEDLGRRLKGRVWLLCTGQQQLEDSEDAGNIGKLKDRFPEALRVHLEPSNIRDVVHKRLLRKNPRREDDLRELFREHKHDLRLNAYGCEGLTEDDFVEVYPLLPRHIDLFMRITSNLRLRSSRVKGDDYAIRGLLQTLGEMFREHDLADRDLGDLVTLDAIYDVHHTAFDVDSKSSMDRLRLHEDVAGHPLALTAAKAVAMLQLVQEHIPTTAETVAQCLYPRLGAGNRTRQVTAALERMKDAGLVAYSEKQGYKLQSTAGQDWQRERDRYDVKRDQESEVVAEKLRELLGGLKSAPKLEDTSFPWAPTYSDERQRQDERLLRPRGTAVANVAFHYLWSSERRAEDLWRTASGADLHKNRLLWVAGDPGELRGLAKELVRSRFILSRYAPRVSSLPPERQRCYYDEQTRQDELEARMADAVARVFLAGRLYFRGRTLEHQRWGESFANVLEKAGEEILRELYDQFVSVSITPKELEQLFQERIDGPSSKFTENGLGLLELDEGTYVPTCRGEVPSRIRQYVETTGGASGAELLDVFGGPPTGYSDSLVKACLAALLRGHHVRFRLAAGAVVTSYRDEGVSELFEQDRPFKRADVLPAGERKITARDRSAIARLFRGLGQKNPGREEEQLADLVFQVFPTKMRELRDLFRRLDLLPGRREPDERLLQLERALEDSHRSRRIEDTLLAVKRGFNDLEEGFPLLHRVSQELTDEAIEAVRDVATARDHQGAQLAAVGEIADDHEDFVLVIEQLESPYPWRDVAFAQTAAKKLGRLYDEVRRDLLDRLERHAEEAVLRLKRRDGFGNLTAERQDHVLKPIDDARRDFERRDDATTPSLKELRDGATVALDRAEEEAGRRLDHALADATGTEVVTFRLDLAGREVTTKADVDALLKELRERLVDQLDKEERVRIRLV